jgi:hypothetical protein
MLVASREIIQYRNESWPGLLRNRKVAEAANEALSRVRAC